DADFRRRVVVAYDRQCAVTGIQLRLIEAAHILPVGADGSTDYVSNGICLSPTYHRAYDNALIYVDERYVMRINKEKERELTMLKLNRGIASFKEPLNKEIFLPPDKAQRP